MIVPLKPHLRLALGGAGQLDLRLGSLGLGLGPIGALGLLGNSSGHFLYLLSGLPHAPTSAASPEGVQKKATVEAMPLPGHKE